MKKQRLAKKLNKSTKHPVLGSVVLGLSVLLAIGALIFVLQRQSASKMETNPIMPTPTPTSILAQTPPIISPTLLPTSNWVTYHNWKYQYSVSVPSEFVPDTQSYTLDQVLSGSIMAFDGGRNNPLKANFTEWQKKYGFTFDLGFQTNSVTSQLVKCPSNEKVNNGLHTFPVYGTLLNRQISGSGWSADFGGGSKQYHYTYLPCINGNYFRVDFDFEDLTPEQIRTKLSVITTILSTITIGN